MDGATLMAAMTYPGYDPPLPLARYTQLAVPCTVALRQADCTTVNRAARPPTRPRPRHPRRTLPAPDAPPAV